MCLAKIRYGVVVALLMLGVLFSTAQDSITNNEKTASYLTIQVPGALSTYPMAINESMAVTGYYMVSSTLARAFLQDGDGTISTFSIPNSLWTEPESINAAGDITGFFEVAAGVPQGFLRYADGRMVTFNPPGFSLNPPEALPVIINDFREIAGNFPFPIVSSSGFTRSPPGMFHAFTFGDSADDPTVVTGLNGSGTVVGYVFNGSPYGSFILHPDGVLTLFEVPAEAGFFCTRTTIASSINADGVIAGWYNWQFNPTPAELCGTTIAGGFVRSPQGAFTLFNAPGPIVTSPAGLGFYGESFSAPNGLEINQQGTITGSYTDEKLAQHGFVREADGVITSFDPPRGMQTSATGINDSGVIVGWFYYDWNNQTSIGFLRIPTL